jgi:tRNA threonylcarbamoyladenosine biosynthesis protein TsaE
MLNERKNTLISRCEIDTERFGRELAAQLSPGTLVTLDGEMGAGKTLLAAAIAVGLGVPRTAVQSPTYVLMRPYLSGKIPIYHWDFYRIASVEELLTADFQELLSERRSVVLIEWASRFPTAWLSFFPRIEIALTPGEDHGSRTINCVHKG